MDSCAYGKEHSEIPKLRKVSWLPDALTANQVLFWAWD
jgi:hypothetical protein